jgi:hypothetical protein
MKVGRDPVLSRLVAPWVRMLAMRAHNGFRERKSPYRSRHA